MSEDVNSRASQRRYHSMTMASSASSGTSSGLPVVRRPSAVWVVSILLIATCVAYLRVGDAGFVNLDDDAYVEQQPMVNLGLRSAGIAWAFGAIHSNNWHPLTTLSHML